MQHVLRQSDGQPASRDSSRLAAHRVVADAVQRWGYWAVPVVFILIGCYIFYKAGVLS